jgi:hypothetical protein
MTVRAAKQSQIAIGVPCHLWHPLSLHIRHSLTVRIILAFLVMGWVVNLIFALASHEPFSIGVAFVYLAACAYGVFFRGLLAGFICWIAIGLGLEGLFRIGTHTHVPAITLFGVLFWSGIAILAGNVFTRE